MKEVKMPYRTYKTKFANNETVSNSYNSKDKSIIVLVDDNRANIIEKKSGLKQHKACIHFVEENQNKFDHMFNYYTEEGLKEQIKEYEKQFNVKCIR